MKRETTPHSTDPIHTLDSDHLLQLGECVRNVVVRLGYGYQTTSALEHTLFREAIAEAITILSSRQFMRERSIDIERDLPDVLPITMEDLAQAIIDHAFSDGISPSPPEREQLARIQVALKLDPTCSDAYVIQGVIAEKQGNYQKAKSAYEKAMELAAAKLGPDVFEETTQVKREFHFWYSDGSRPYMRPRAALAYLLWQKMGNLKEAIAHFQTMLILNPGDNQGNRYALLCCLLEAGDDAALEKALEYHRTWNEDTVEPMDITDTCWHYTYACWQFRRQSLDNPLVGEATKALRKAFEYNKHVPHLMLNSEARATFGEFGTYAAGDEDEAAWYIDFSLKGWQQTPGARTWLEAVARQAKLL